jgi:hypothetical protein
MLPVGVAELLPAHEVSTVKGAGYTGLDNGELLRRAASAGYDVLVTADRNLPAQRNIPVSGIAIVLVPGNRLAEMTPHAESLQRVVASARRGSVTRAWNG